MPFTSGAQFKLNLAKFRGIEATGEGEGFVHLFHEGKEISTASLDGRRTTLSDSLPNRVLLLTIKSSGKGKPREIRFV